MYRFNDISVSSMVRSINSDKIYPIDDVYALCIYVIIDDTTCFMY